MLLTLHNLKQRKKQRKAVGRGNASGKGTTAGRGTKGQKARTGGKGGLKKMGIKQTIMKLKKQKGFTSLNENLAVVNLEQLDKNFETGEKVTLKKLLKKGLIPSLKSRVKILGRGALSKKMTVQAHKFSQSAKDGIEKNGGTVELARKEKEKTQKKKSTEVK